MTHKAMLYVLGFVVAAGACDHAAPKQPAASSVSPSPLEYRWVAGASDEAGSSIVLPRRIDGDSAMVNVTAPFLTLADVDSIIVRAGDSGESTVAAVIRADARDRLQTVTGQRVGSQVAVVIDGSVVTIATVRSELASVLPIATRAPADADRIAERLRSAQQR